MTPSGIVGCVYFIQFTGVTYSSKYIRNEDLLLSIALFNLVVLSF